MTTSDHPIPRIHLQEFQEYYRNPENSKHIREGQCTKIYWHIKLYTTEHPPLGSSPEMVYDKHKQEYWNYWSPEVRTNKIKLRKICPNKKLHNTAYLHFFDYPWNGLKQTNIWMKIKPRKSREMGHMRVRGTDIFQNYNGH